MPRARNIKPSLFKNEILGVADPIYTLLFEGLWTLADREGRLEDRPLRIKAELFPYREISNFDGFLQWLADNEFIIRYEVGGERYIQITNFTKHQRPHANELASVIPAFTEVTETSEKIESTSDFGASTFDQGDKRLSLDTDSFNTDPLNIETLNTETANLNGARAIAVNPNGSEQEFFETVTAGLCSRMNLVSLPNHANWVAPLTWAFQNNFTPEQIFECYDLMKAQKWRTGAISGRALADNLPNLEILRDENNGSNQRHYTDRDRRNFEAAERLAGDRQVDERLREAGIVQVGDS